MSGHHTYNWEVGGSTVDEDSIAAETAETGDGGECRGGESHCISSLHETRFN